MSALLDRTVGLDQGEDAIDLPVRDIGRLDVAAVDGRRIVDLLAERLDKLHFTRLAFANAHCVNVAADDARYAADMRRFVVLPDGVGVDIASKVLHGAPFPENLNGTDFVPAFLDALAGRRRVALVGAAPGTAEAAAANLARVFPRHEFRAISHGFFREGLETEIVLARLRAFSPDVTLFALGVPKQELFIARHVTIHETTLAIGVGALLDFLAGTMPRAPEGWRRLRLEWLYRLLQEPSRLWRRYILGNPKFLLGLLAQRLFRSSRRRASGKRSAKLPLSASN